MIRAAFLLVTFLIFSCDRDDFAKKPIRIERNISNTKSLGILLSRGMPVECGISITTQEKNYTLSEIRHREEGVFYLYEPKEGFPGTDTVEIPQEHSDGTKVYAQTATKVIISVTE